MTEPTKQPAELVEVVDYDPRWPQAYEQERNRLLGATGNVFEEFEHIGSTAVPGLAAKPIIDMMAGVRELAQANDLRPVLEGLGYEIIETGMPNRLFLRKYGEGTRYHLHIVETATWDDRKERHLRDYLIANPAEAAAYGALKSRLAEEFRDDPLACTKAKTGFVQRAIDAVRDAKGLPRVDVWEE